MNKSNKLSKTKKLTTDNYFFICSFIVYILIITYSYLMIHEINILIDLLNKNTFDV